MDLNIFKNEVKRLKEIEDKLRISERRYRFLVDNFNEAILIVKDGRILFSNAKAPEIFGWQNRILDNMPIEELIHPDDKQMVLDRYYKRIQGQNIPQNYDVRAIDENGNTRWLWVNAVRTPWEGQTATLVFLADITDRKRFEEALSKSETKYRELVERTADLVAQFDYKGRITFVNHVAQKVFGLEPKKCYGLSIFDFIHPDDKLRTIKAFNDWRLHRPNSAQIDNRLLNNSGDVCYMLWMFNMHYDHNNNLVSVNSIAHDITERKKAEQACIDYQNRLRSLTAELTLAEERERRSVASYLHDSIGQPISVAIMKLQRLRRAINNEEAISSIDDIIALIDRASEDIRSLTTELGNPALYELGFEEGVRWLAEKICRNTSLDVRVNIFSNLEFFDEENRLVLFRSVSELLHNIVKHANAERAEISVESTLGFIKICVCDDGIGFNTSKALDRVAWQSGFGLFSIKERIDYIGGNFRIESELGKGTKAILEAPVEGQAPYKKP